MQRFDLPAIKSSIKAALTAKERSARSVSIAADMGPDTLGKFLNGETQSLRAENLARVLELLEITNDAFPVAQGMGEDAPGVRYGGIVEAGAFRPDDGLNQENEWRTVPISPDRRYPAHAQYAFEVVGDSMNEAKIFHGMWVLTVDIETWERIHGEPRDGDLVVVARTRDGHPERELTVKRMRIFRDRIELQPESTNKTYEPIVYALPRRDDEWSGARIIGMLITSSWLHR